MKTTYSHIPQDKVEEFIKAGLTGKELNIVNAMKERLEKFKQHREIVAKVASALNITTNQVKEYISAVEDNDVVTLYWNDEGVMVAVLKAYIEQNSVITAQAS